MKHKNKPNPLNGWSDGPVCCLAGVAILALVFTVSIRPASGQYDPDAPEPLAGLGGSLVLGGGGELPAEVFDTFVELAGGEEARIVVVRAISESADDADHADSGELLSRFRVRKVASAVLFDARSVGATNMTASTESLSEATGVWFESSDPERIAAIFGTDSLRAELAGVIERGGVVGANGGSSLAMTRVMITRGAPHASVGRGLGLLPGSVVEVGFTKNHRRNRLLGVLASQPRLVGFGIDEGTAMVVRRRFVTAVGDGNVVACVAASETRPLRIDRVNGRRRADLIALNRSATARTLPPFPPADPPPPNVVSGSLVIVGGGGVPPGLMKRFIDLAGGPDAPIVYVPCSSAEEIDEEPRFVRSVRRAGANNVTWVHTKDRDKATSDDQFLAPLREARGVWFGGGRQWNLVDSYQHTTAHKLMHDVLARGGVIGGSSAGASIQADYMARGDPLGNLNIIAEGYEQGLGFITGVAIDQHFTQRGRLPDMTSLVDTHPQLLGIGLDERTAIVVQGSIAEVVGQGRAHFYDRTVAVIPGEADYTALVAGRRYNLRDRRVLEGNVLTARATAALVGVWRLSSEVNDEAIIRRLSINKDLTGSYQGDGGERYPLVNVRVRGDRVSFRVKGDKARRAPSLYFDGRWDGASLRGSIALGRGAPAIATVVGTKSRDGDDGGLE